MKSFYPKHYWFKFILLLFVGSTASRNSYSQDKYFYKGTVINSEFRAIENVTIKAKNTNISVVSEGDGTFLLSAENKVDSLEFSCVGYNSLIINPNKETEAILLIQMERKTERLESVIIGARGRSSNYLIKKVIANKDNNNPSRFNAYTYQRYTRNELDFDNIDFEKADGNGLKSLLLNTYRHFDSTAKEDKELPVYFAENISNITHSVNPKIEDEITIAEKNLGLKTDELLKDLNKFYVVFNIYDEWIPVFDQTYVSPLNTNALRYYKFTVGDTLIENGDSIVQISFLPLRSYEKAFKGNLWINISNFAVINVNMRLNKNANLNFVSDINYNEEYKKVYSPTKEDKVYMPYKYLSEIKFESGLALLGIPTKANKKKVNFIIKNTTVTANINLSETPVKLSNKEKKEKENLIHVNSNNEYWNKYRPDSLTNQEKNIYAMMDSLKSNQRFQNEIKLISLVGSGYWDIKNKIRIGPTASIVSTNSIEGFRFRTGFWTMPGINKDFNFNAYAAYGTKDKLLKGNIGVKYIWNHTRWTKTTINYSADYDLLNNNADELDNDNIISSFFKKDVPFSRLFIKNAEVKHEQYLNHNWSLNSSVNFKEIKPAFDFKYNPLIPSSNNQADTISYTTLPVAEATMSFRYAHDETTLIFNYDNLKQLTFYPVVTTIYTHGFAVTDKMFNYDKLSVSLQQWLRLPPKFLLYYKIETGTVMGTVPYLLMNIPAGNQYFVASKYVFNTMNPYEFVADRYVSLQSRLHLGGTLFENIPFIQKLGWRERFSFNAYWGDMSNTNKKFNTGASFNIPSRTPFMEASVGVENIFHFLSIEYFKRLSYLSNPNINKSGLYFGVTIVF